MTAATLLAVLAAATAGMGLALQASLNTAAGRLLGDPVAAAALSFGVGFAALTTVALARSGGPAGAALAGLPWWAWVGGLLGACYMVAILWATPQVGVLTVMAAAVLGQMVGAMALDALGAFGLAPQAISWRRVAAVALVACGVALSRA